ncbi:hypothetical protein LIER_37082 [Lithospermum erythrorhizon]|uniref:Uncharacterized protein n=1 Tax=Lithospermum erythrorhizon TaxID=34254 RepID=A0AAV3PEZ3_LITER
MTITSNNLGVCQSISQHPNWKGEKLVHGFAFIDDRHIPAERKCLSFEVWNKRSKEARRADPDGHPARKKWLSLFAKEDDTASPQSPNWVHMSLRLSFRSDNIVYDNGHKADEYDNGLIGRPILTTIKAIVPPIHLKLKFPMAGGIGEMSGDQNALACVTKHPFPQSTQVPEIRSQGTNGKVNLKSTR